MKLGFSGTQEGMTEEQIIVTSSIVTAWAVEGIEEFHHGCCIGSDEKFHKIVRLMFEEYPIIGHPPRNHSKVAKWALDDCESLWPEKDYLPRNMDIATVCDRLIATPKEFSMVLRSGTWSTIRYFQNRNKELWVITPDGRLLRPKRGDLY